jgi:large subunit ribosomal protein L13
MRTYSTKAADIDREWRVIDASDKTLGRLASEVAGLLKGKHKPIYSPHLDVGDYVIVVNAARVRVTGDKMTKKIYYRHSQYPGGLKSTSLGRMMETHPIRVIEHAVKGMLPRNRLGAAMYRKLKVYPGSEHPHQGQVKATEKEGQVE